MKTTIFMQWALCTSKSRLPKKATPSPMENFVLPIFATIRRNWTKNGQKQENTGAEIAPPKRKKLTVIGS